MAENNWSDEELEITLIAYLIMIDLDKSGKKYNKQALYRNIAEKYTDGRTKGSVERRMGNISHLMIKKGLPIVSGISVLSNTGSGIENRMLGLLERLQYAKKVIGKFQNIKNLIIGEETEISKESKELFPYLSEKEKVYNYRQKIPYQIICFGAPGTGKSKYIDDITLACVNNDKECCIRTAFHPDTDYASFVGCYKPVADNEGKIQYKYVPQAFTTAYVKAWRNPHRDFFLIIEEINRGNCAQIFGDIFQLLDRDSNGVSSYDVKPDKDLQQYLKEAFLGAENQIDNIPIQIGDIMKLPANLHIYATMNTSDQSLFSIDSAFKRRWDWQYMPIVDEKRNHRIAVAGNEYD
ncbi:MAG: AAA family ATPase [Oxalobacter sp.]|nr:AAA family ATPase [Oxalobacter sp.]